jgi:hypothetical protein
MGLSLRLAAGGGDTFVPKETYEELANEGVHFAEPTDVTEEQLQEACTWEEFKSYPSLAFPYGFVHLLRRLYIRKKLDAAMVPAPVGDADEDEKYESYMAGTDLSLAVSSHLVYHGDADGIYVPVDFAKPLWLGEGRHRFSVGSTQRLVAELDVVEAALGKLAEDDAFEREVHTLGALREMARLSLAYKTSIVFS